MILLHQGPDAKAPVLAKCAGGKRKKTLTVELISLSTPFKNDMVHNGDAKVERGLQEKKKTSMHQDGEREWTWSMPTAISESSTTRSKPQPTDSLTISTTPVSHTNRHFAWRQVSSPELDVRDRNKSKPSFTSPHIRLIDTSTGEVHAVFFWEKSGIGLLGQSCGKVQFRRSLGHEWEWLVLLTLGTLVERERMRKDSQGNYTTGMLCF